MEHQEAQIATVQANDTETQCMQESSVSIALINLKHMLAMLAKFW
jgi:hypothetical protein